MAEAADDDAWQKLKKARLLQELYHGRFTQKDAIAIMNHKNWDINAAVQFTFTATQPELREVLGQNDWQVVERAVRNDRLRDSARSKHVPPEFRQFACEGCDKVWWRKVPVRKPVSRCNVCKTKLDALPRDLEHGWAVFHCLCGHEFHGFGAMGKTECRCFSCMIHFCMPDSVLPPMKREKRRSRYRHSCTAPNCFNRTLHGPRAPLINLCVHPKSLRRQVIEPSTRHVSTGSTVKTFLTQDELMGPFSPYEPSLVDIAEIPSDNEGN